MGKFTKEQAIKGLEALIPAKDKELDLSRTIAEAVDNSLELIGEDSEMELGDFVEKVYKQVKTSIGLTHSENSKVANKMQLQLDELKQRLEGKTPPKTETDQTGIKSDDPAIQALIDKIAKMEEKEQKREAEQSVAEKRSQLVAKMKESIKDEGWINDYLSEITITKDTDVEAKAKDYVAFYNKTQSNGGRFTPKPTGDGSGDETARVKQTIEGVKAIMKQHEGLMAGSPVTTTQV